MDDPLTESSEELIARVTGFERDTVPDGLPFSYPPGLAQKVDPAGGSFRAFFGTTVIASVSPQGAAWIAEFCADLHWTMGEVLAEPLRRGHCT